jgi:hypothetical protein
LQGTPQSLQGTPQSLQGTQQSPQTPLQSPQTFSKSPQTPNFKTINVKICYHLTQTPFISSNKNKNETNRIDV